MAYREKLLQSCNYFRATCHLPITTLSEGYSIHERTVYKWLAVPPAPTFGPKRKTGRRRKVSEEVEREVCEWMMADCTRRQVDCVKMVTEKHGVNLTRQTISRIMTRNGVTRKRLSSVNPGQIGREDQVAAFQEQMAAFDCETWAAMDESSFNTNEIPRYGYAPKGQAPVAVKPTGKKQSFLLLLTLRYDVRDTLQNAARLLIGDNANDVEGAGEGEDVNEAAPGDGPVVAWKVVKGGVNAVVFQKYLSEDIGSKVSRKGMNLAIDNARIHHATKACVENGIPTIPETAVSKRIGMRYIPPYCPQVNPCEHAFAFIKQNFVRPARPRTERDLLDAVERGLTALTQTKVNNMFEHCFRRAKLPKVTDQRLGRKAAVVAEDDAVEQVENEAGARDNNEADVMVGEQQQGNVDVVVVGAVARIGPGMVFEEGAGGMRCAACEGLVGARGDAGDVVGAAAAVVFTKATAGGHAGVAVRLLAAWNGVGQFDEAMARDLENAASYEHVGGARRTARRARRRVARRAVPPNHPDVVFGPPNVQRPG
ncbi:hypothetical protein M427DRAFT_30512 [Gonapodya prolifera JEL478]|uniref:Tc1-like transposase DDE domain-containing protein n=1 Tax=Gonapodya prolifera (strain JEL478) TaxID=1344416 RepID=A0A139AL05_GONPJ|nr:hypothetical protein M427DRAFT_30512 [Gonapodya prolifera JEL478]|eukprot:KXS17378.1 hypothetical protein M427DRAFT_30512 [Gonapodya prolifera JEL478]